MKTYIPPQSDIQRRWYVVDADGLVLGRMATEIASVLRGKKKAIFTPHLDTGDFVIVVNAAKVRLTGKKTSQKAYFRHTGYPGGVKWTLYSEMIKKHPERVIWFAVKGMLPKNKLGRAQLKKLKVYRADKHPHDAQQPERLDLTQIAGVERFNAKSAKGRGDTVT
jgi:large subunit ribosomal protein L13